MKAISSLLMSLKNLTGLQLFEDLARPLIDVTRKTDEVKRTIEQKKTDIKRTKDAVNNLRPKN